MKRILLFLLPICAVCVFCTTLSAKAFPYAGDISGGIVGTDDNWDSYIDLLIPVSGNEKSFIFIAPRTSMTGKSVFESDANEFNIGIGFRKYLENFLKDGAVIGFNAYYDTRNTRLGNNFQQAGAGIELLSKWFDFRVNGYIPFGNDEYFLGKLYDAPSNHHIATTYYYEAAMSGFDGEIGIRIPLPSWAGELRAFGGYYYFDADKAAVTHGFKGRVEYRPLNVLRFNYVMYENDNFSGTDWQAGAEIKLPFDMRKFLQGKNPFAGLLNYIKTRPLQVKDRIGEMVMRDMYVRVKEASAVHHNEKLSSPSGAEYYITVVSPDGTGDGTFENPASLEDGTLLNKSVTGDNAVLLLLGGSYSISSTIDLSGHLANEVLVIGPQEIEYRGGNLSKITRGNPLLETTSGVTAFSVNTTGSESFLISSIEFIGTGNSGTGLEISNYDQELIVQNNNFSGFDTGARINNSSASVVFSNNIFENNNTGVEIFAKAASLEENLFVDNTLQAVLLSGSNGADVSYNLFENNEKGIAVYGGQDSEVRGNVIYGGSYGIYSSSSSSMNFWENDISSASQSGIYSYSDNRVQINKNDIYDGMGSGISIINSSGAVLSSNDIFNNRTDGIYVSGGSGQSVELNALYENGENGLYSENITNASLSQNTVYDNSINGIYLSDVSSSLVSDNKTSSNTVAGIYIESSDNVTIEQNTSYYNDIGILAEGGSDVRISSNIADSNREGIKASGVSGFIALSNDVSSNTSGGMYFVNMSSAVIQNNFVQFNKGYGGVYIENLTDSTVTGNTASFNETAGITVKGSSGMTISLNAFDNDNTGHGLYLVDSADTVLTWNIFQSYGSSGYFGLYMQNNVTFDAAGSGANRFFDSSYGGSVSNYESDVKSKDYFY